MTAEVTEKVVTRYETWCRECDYFWESSDAYTASNNAQRHNRRFHQTDEPTFNLSEDYRIETNDADI